LRNNEVGLLCNEFLRESLHRLGVERRPPSVNPNVAALGPAELLESLPECGEECLIFVVVLGHCHQHADPAHPVRLLRARPKRPRNGRAAERG